MTNEQSELDTILQRAFAYGCEVGSLDKDYKVSGVKYIPTGELQALTELMKTKMLEIIGDDEDPNDTRQQPSIYHRNNFRTELRAKVREME